MTNDLPPHFRLPRATFEAQRRLVATYASGDRGHRRARRLRATAIAVAAGLAVLVATPALGLGGRIAGLFDWPASPEEAQKRTGVAPESFNETTYDGFPAEVLLYEDGAGRICVADRFGTRTEGSGVGYQCSYPNELFRGPRPSDPRQAIDVYGPAAAQESNRADFDPTNWDKMWFYGLTWPEVERVTVVMSDCSRRPAALDEERFKGMGVFLYIVPREDLHARVWPYRLVAEDARGSVVYDKPIAGITVP